MKIIFLLLIPVFFVSCLNPDRLGVRYHGKLIVFSNANIVENPNIKLSVNPLSRKDKFNDIGVLKNRFTSCLNKNESFTELRTKYPDIKIDLEIMPYGRIYRTWIMDAVFLFPLYGQLFPFTPWWGAVNLESKLTITVPDRIIGNFKFKTSQPFSISFYPYYRTGNVLTKKYSIAYDSLFQQVSKYNFDEFAKNANQQNEKVVLDKADNTEMLEKLKWKTRETFLKNSIYGTFGSAGLYFTATGYYEHIFWQGNKEAKDKNLAGFGRFGYGSFADWGFTGKNIIVEGGIITGAKRAHFEAALGANYFFEHIGGMLTPAISAGYRGQKPGGNFIFRTGVGYPEMLYIGFGAAF